MEIVIPCSPLFVLCTNKLDHQTCATQAVNKMSWNESSGWKQRDKYSIFFSLKHSQFFNEDSGKSLVLVATLEL